MSFTTLSIAKTLNNLRKVNQLNSFYLYLNPFLSSEKPKRYRIQKNLQLFALPKHISTFERLLLEHKIQPPLLTCTLFQNCVITMGSFVNDDYGALIVKKAIENCCEQMNEELKERKVTNQIVRQSIVECRRQLEQCWIEDITFNRNPINNLIQKIIS